MSESALKVSGLRKTFGDFVAVDDMSFVVPPGGSLAIVGESGSGKTTTARMIAGLERPTAGSLAISGAPPSRDRLGRARQIQMVFQDPYSSLDRRQKIRDCIAEALRLHSRLRGQAFTERVDELLDMVGLDERQGRALPKTLSGGQRQRVAIARSLAATPRILVLDEAVAALDVSIQAQILTLLAALRRDTGVTLLFITHDLAVVPHISDEILVMQHGRVVEHGKVDAVLGHPTDPYTRRLVDAIPRPGWVPRRATGTP
jgi:ABC-type glutathione transport system ATPase component